MMLSKKSLSCVEDLLGDCAYEDASITIVCNREGKFVGKLFLDRRLQLVTENKEHFSEALFDIIKLCEDVTE